MADDIVILGGRERGSKRQAEEAIEELFRTEYRAVASSAFAVVGDGRLAEQVATLAFMDLWRHQRRDGLRAGDSGEATRYLRGAVTRLAGEAGRGRGIGSADPGGPSEPASGRGIGSADPGGPPEADVDRAWHEFEALRERRTAVVRRELKALVAVVTLAAVAAGLLALANQGHAGRGRQAPRRAPFQPVTLAPAPYPGAIVARFGLSGVISVVGDAVKAWAIRQIPQARAVEQPALSTRYQLVAIDLRTNAVLYRIKLGAERQAIAAGAGRVWLTTSSGEAAGQIERIDPASGRVVQKLHLRAGPCTQLSFTPGHLYAACRAETSAGTEFWMINPATGRAVRLAGPVLSSISSLIAAPDALWYVADYSRLIGLSQFTGRPIAVRPRRMTVSPPGFQYVPPGSPVLAYDSGSIWALGQSEQLARIDPITGKVVRHYTYRTFDPTRAGGLDFLTAAGGWLWFLDDGYPFSGVLRVSEASGQPVGGVPIAPGACGQTPCSLIFATPGSIWVPTAQLLLRIDPFALPTTAPFGEPVNQLDADGQPPG